eukprot:scaffold259099_cov35-Prasinocladus_malaysianus.AAC.8
MLVAVDVQVTLSWDSPTYDGGCEIEGYSVDVSLVNPSARTFSQIPPVYCFEHEVVIEDVENCVPYRFEIKAENCKGYGPGQSVVATPIPSSTPRIVTASSLGIWCPK